MNHSEVGVKGMLIKKEFTQAPVRLRKLERNFLLLVGDSYGHYTIFDCH